MQKIAQFKKQSPSINLDDPNERVYSLTEVVEIKVSRVVGNLNAMRKFPLSDDQIEGWSRIIVRLMPVEDIRKLQFVVDQMIMGKLDYDHEVGIRNLFVNVKQVEEVNGRFEILKATY